MQNTFLWVFLLASFGLIQITGQYSKPIEADKFLNPPPEMIERFTFGFKESTADSLWLRWVQDSDTCQTYLKPVEKLEPVLAKKGERFVNPRYKNCDNSWAFKMLDAITKVAPLFKMPYLAGAISLSVLTEDYEGATLIFERGLKQYPSDWSIAFRAAYHYLFDRNDKDRAAELLMRAEKNGAPAWVNFLAARLYSESGKIELGVTILENYRKSQTDEKAIASIDKRIAELKRQLQP